MKKPLSPKAVADLVPDGARVMIGGFMGVGTPNKIIDALVVAGKKSTTIQTSNDPVYSHWKKLAGLDKK